MTESNAKAVPETTWDEPVRVVLLLDDTHEGVTPVYVARLATRLNRMQVRLVVCCLSGHGGHSEKIQGTDTSVVALDGKSTGSLWDGVSSVMRVREVLVRFRPDVLHALGPQSRWVAPLAALGSATSVVVRAQDELTQKGCGRRLLRLWSQTAGRVSRRVLSREKNSARRRRFLRGSGIDQVIPEAVDVSAVRGRVASNLEGVVAGSFVVGAYVGAGAIEEGRKILDAFRVFAARRGPADLVVWGAGADQRLESTAAEMDLGDRVHCLEDPHEPAELISALQVVWSMGICERSRVTVLSAMALGVPVVCSHETDLAEGIREIGGALMRDVLWPRQFAEATRELAENSELTSALQSAGPILMNQRHRFYDHAVQIRELYDQLASGSMGSASGTGTGFKSSSTLT